MKKTSTNGHSLAKLLNSQKLTAALGVLAAVLVIALIVMIILVPSNGQSGAVVQNPQETDAVLTTWPTPTERPEASLPPIEVNVGSTESGEMEMLPHMQNWYSKNIDVIGYLRIPETRIDNVVMYTPEDSTKYLYHNIEGKFRASGELLLDTRCNVDPESTVLMIHGHNMVNGTKFHDLLSYTVKDYWKTHSKVYYTTLYEEREYEVFAAFYDKVYDVDADVFKFYEFINPQTEEEYNEGISYFKSRSKFDSGITPEFGQRLLMLVTCEYSTPNGRFVVVAREVPNE